jgi:dihydrolipoamide dehydrogenase
MARESTQLAVLGAGPGGYAAAFYAADLGMQVTLVDMEKNPGGVCLYRGCIPSKALLHVSKVVDESRHASAWGVTFAEPKIDVDKLRGFKQGVVDKLTSGVGQVARMRKVKYIQGRATLTGPKSMTIAGESGETELQFEHCILATGSSPTKVPSLALDSPRMMDSTSGLELPDIPKSLLVIGGGYIGLELGTVYATLGSKVSVVEMTGGLLPGADRDLVSVLQKRLEKLFAKIMLNTKVVKVGDEKNGVRVTFEGEASGDQTFDRVLVAVGRRPNSKIPGLEKTAVKVDEKGFIETDPQRRTAEPTIFAIGDVAGEPMLAHKASHEARVAVEAIQGHKAVFEPLAIPAVVFTDPEIAWTGLTEAQAQAEGRDDVEVARFPWGALSRAITIDRPEGVTKLVLEKKTGRVLGAGIAGSGAGELIAEATLAIEMGATAEDMRLTIHPHPTLSESLMEAAEVFFGQSTHVYKPKRR